MGYLAIFIIFLTSNLCYRLAECETCPSLQVSEHNCTCEPDTAGQLKFAEGNILVCDGYDWNTLQYEPPAYGSEKNPGSSCQDIKTNRQGAANGVYWISLQSNNSEAFPVYCDMEAGGWTMVYKAVSGVSENAYEIYNSDDTHHENERSALDVTKEYFADYKNRIVLNWDDFNPAEATVVLYKGGNVVKELNFNAQGSDKLNWFRLDRLTDTPWDDIRSEQMNFFTLSDENNRRDFFINRNYGGCGKDAGWLVITGINCDWETHYGENTILYSALSTYTKWNTYANIEVADVLVVYLRQ